MCRCRKESVVGLVTGIRGSVVELIAEEDVGKLKDKPED